MGRDLRGKISLEESDNRNCELRQHPDTLHPSTSKIGTQEGHTREAHDSTRDGSQDPRRLFGGWAKWGHKVIRRGKAQE
jgi:hypothetical protein